MYNNKGTEGNMINKLPLRNVKKNIDKIKTTILLIERIKIYYLKS